MLNGVNQFIQALLKSTNPNQMIAQAAQHNPALQQAMQAVNGKTPQQIKDMAYGIARQRGIDLGMLAKQLGIKLPN